jgi:hypothetical protein
MRRFAEPDEMDKLLVDVADALARASTSSCSSQTPRRTTIFYGAPDFGAHAGDITSSASLSARRLAAARRDPDDTTSRCAGRERDIGVTSSDGRLILECSQDLPLHR